MAFTVILGEDDVRRMPAALRETLLKWYFDERLPKPVVDTIQPIAEATALPTEKIDIDNFVDGNRRVTFAELVRAGFLRKGDEIYCKSLKRQQRAGAEAFIKAARVTDNGTVDFLGRRFSNPSALAKAMVNANGGEAKNANGYDYLFVRSSENGLLPLKELRRRLLAAATTLMETGAFGNNFEEALDYAGEMFRDKK